MKLEMNIQLLTFNIQRPKKLRGGRRILCWALNVQGSMFLLLSAPPLCAQTATNALPALAPAYGEIPPTFWELHQTAIIIGGFALLAFAFLLLKTLLRPESKPVLPPEVLARTGLEKLRRKPEDGILLSEVSQILRRYLIAAFELPPGEMTTAEFCAAIFGNTIIGAELAKSISDFLYECDLRKFSTSPAAAPLNAVARALEIVASVEKHRAHIPTPR